MMWPRRRDYVVTLWLDGRAPLRSPALDLPSHYVKFTVKARSFNHAERVAVAALVASGQAYWHTSTRTITRL